jgi:hypothetical protein
VRCLHCSQRASAALTICPHCGAELRHSAWPQVLSSVAVLAGLGLGLVLTPVVSRGLTEVKLASGALPRVKLSPVDLPGLSFLIPSPTLTSTPTATPTVTRRPNGHAYGDGNGHTYRDRVSHPRDAYSHANAGPHGYANPCLCRASPARTGR